MSEKIIRNIIWRSAVLHIFFNFARGQESKATSELDQL